MLTVYGIKSCDTCRTARKYLAENDIEFRFHDVRDDGLDIQMLERWSGRIDANQGSNSALASFPAGSLLPDAFPGP